MNSTVIVLIAILVMGTLIFCFDWTAVRLANFLFG